MKNSAKKSIEDQLMLEFAKGNIKAFEQLYKLHANNVFAYARRILRNKTEAEDITQEVFSKIWAYKDKYQPKSYFRAWAMRICMNLCIDKKRKSESKNIELKEFDLKDSPEASNPELITIAKETIAHANIAFLKLSNEEQHLLALRISGELTVQETAETLGCSIRTIHYKTAHTIKKFKKLMGEKS